ncbi:uncharacterized protein ASCRUDRAFT_39295 [Ascoidea rubescens DSM 1968]|uniref:Vacuolar calcium ion transporter n=1 Tax=Ascoidea rubescens DSM 1968 TaxID=1344418 RepID=A0A1D2V9Y8_9ASCO|nr:hypothetical protein ASCRUDRAFT_39295 [Ascoidea rubescens DSM 1968]ODV58476.1 hypothetical protein ASCRUDRAFT_39295 [Ascoidea rubescens DSM 1968]
MEKPSPSHHDSASNIDDFNHPPSNLLFDPKSPAGQLKYSDINEISSIVAEDEIGASKISKANYASSNVLSCVTSITYTPSEIDRIVEKLISRHFSTASINVVDPRENRVTILKKLKNKTISGFSFSSIPPISYFLVFSRFIKKKAGEDNYCCKILKFLGWPLVLYPFIIVGIIVGANHKTVDPTLVFVFNILAILPLSINISSATEALANLTNSTIGALINVTFGNSIELIFAIIALTKGELLVVQCSMTGSYLVNAQLILGGAICAGSIHFKELKFDNLMAYFNIIFIAFNGFIFRLVYYFNFSMKENGNKDPSSISDYSNPSLTILKISRAISVLKIILYIIYLVLPIMYKKFLHSDVENEKTSKYRIINLFTKHRVFFLYALFLLANTIIVAFNSEYILDSMDAFSESSGLSKDFISLIIIPIICNSAEHVSSIVVAYKGKMNLAVNIAVGSAVQIDYFISPFLVLIASATVSDYSFLYEGLIMECYFAACLLTCFVIMLGKGYFIAGVLSLFVYTVVGILIYYMVF